jgi:hypothetical protein
MQIQSNTNQTFSILAAGHDSDAVLQAWTWRFFRELARDLGGHPCRRNPEFETAEGATAWVKIVSEWYAVVHQKATHATGAARAFASRTQASLGNMGVAKTSPEGEDLGWTPVTYIARKGRWNRIGWALCDGAYGLIEYFAEKDEETADDQADDVMAEAFQAIDAGAITGLTSHGVRWSFVALADYGV